MLVNDFSSVNFDSSGQKVFTEEAEKNEPTFSLNVGSGPRNYCFLLMFLRVVLICFRPSAILPSSIAIVIRMPKKTPPARYNMTPSPFYRNF